MINPLVSIIVPCYNQEQYLGEALQSVLDQTYANWECIIVNDGSPDNTEEVARKWLHKDARFKYVHQENGGLSSARNSGISKAVGVFILPLDADDRISADYINQAINAFKEDTSLKVVYCKAAKFGDEVGSLNLAPFSISTLAKENMIFCTAMYRKEDWQKVGGYDTKMIYGLEDWEFWISLLKKGGEVRCLEEICFFYRIKENSMLKNLNQEKLNYLLEYMSIKHSDYFVKQLGSFNYLYNCIELANQTSLNKLKSKKNVIDLCFKTFLGFSVFDKK